MTLQEAFRDQAFTCTKMGSPFMGRLLTILAEHWDTATPLGQAMALYEGDIGPAGHSLPLRIAGGLHALVLQAKDPGLTAVYPPNSVADDELRAHVIRALARHEKFLLNWTKLPPQTNEVRRSAALIAMAQMALSKFYKPVWLSELGASAGLNLVWDHFALEIGGTRFGPEDAIVSLTPEWEGPLPPRAKARIAGRAGVDLNPLSPQDPDALLRMCSYLWADQPDRIERTRAAASVQTTVVDKGDAIEWLAARLAQAPLGHMHIIQHTVAWQYFPTEAQDRGKAIIEAAGSRATEDSPVAWMQMETDGDKTGQVGAALTLRLWPGDLTFSLGRADFHGRWVKWTG